ncbi:MAG TPA: hypothetical protein VI957_00190 [Candidatus Paceibacterota bacterium]
MEGRKKEGRKNLAPKTIAVLASAILMSSCVEFNKGDIRRLATECRVVSGILTCPNDTALKKYQEDKGYRGQLYFSPAEGKLKGVF